MKNKFVLIICGIILALGILVFVIFSNIKVSSKIKKIIGETDITKKTYGYPIISLLVYNSNSVNVEAGYYRYGDVNLDGKIDENDIDDISLIITSNLYFSQSQKILADVDENGQIDIDDINLFKKYLKQNGSVNYNLNSNTLEYCVSKKNDSSDCTWNDNNIFKLSEKKNYYFFVRQKNTGVISESSLLKQDVFDKKQTDILMK